MSLQNQMLASVPTVTSINKDIKDSHQKNFNNNIISQNFNNSTKKFKTFDINIFSQVKNMLDIRQVLEYYGLSVNSRGFVSCPYHQENTPSFKVYDSSYYCFGCNESGTVIDFVMKHFGLTAIEAVKKLNDDFRLNIPIGGSAGVAISHFRQGDKNLVRDFKEWEKQAFKTLSSYFKILRFCGEQIYINHVEHFNKYLPDLDNILFVETLVDMMIENTSNFEAQVEFYRDFGEAVTVIEHKLHS